MIGSNGVGMPDEGQANVKRDTQPIGDFSGARLGFNGPAV